MKWNNGSYGCIEVNTENSGEKVQMKLLKG